MYAPSVNDRSGEILADAMNNASAVRLGGTQALASGIQSAGGSIGDTLTAFDQVMAKQKANFGALESLKSIGPSVGLTQDDLDSLATIKDPDKLAGALSMYGTLIDQRMKEQYLEKQLETGRELAAYKASVAPRRPPAPTQAILPPVTFGDGIDFSR